MSYHANVSMVFELIDHILPKVWEVRPDLKLWVVGKDPTREIIRLGSRPNVIVTGTVDDIRPYLQQATIAVAPLTYGAGIQNKILEAMACATPVIAYPSGVSALNVEPNVDLLVGEDPNHFARQILTLLDDNQLRSRIGLSGRQYVLKNHSWEVIVSNLLSVYEAAINNLVV